MDSHTLWVALALVLIIEGLFPFASPQAWKRAFLALMQMDDGQVRFIGLSCIVAGMLLLWWLL
jgi:uncharacterized protein YjeT (DUF2065 family)